MTPTIPLFATVRIKELGITGFVDSINIFLHGTTYRVIHYFDGARREEWMYEREIEAVDTNTERTA